MYYCFPTIFCVLTCLIPTAAISAQDLDSPRPIAGIDSVFIEEMTWMDVRDAIRDGKTTAIVATGGVEQNGPYVAEKPQRLSPLEESSKTGLTWQAGNTISCCRRPPMRLRES